jgi:hypothetical protein
MATPSPAALAIASLIENALASVFSQLATPLVERIDALENELRYPKDNTAKFDAAVMTAIRNQPGAVVDFLAEEIDKRAPADEFIEKAVSAVLASEEFDTAVLGVIEDRSSDVIDNLDDELIDKIKSVGLDDITDRVADVIRAGSFNVEFSRY